MTFSNYLFFTTTSEPALDFYINCGLGSAPRPTRLALVSRQKDL